MTELIATHDDDALLHQLRTAGPGGSRGVLDELVRRHVDFVYSAARRQVAGDPHLAEDVTQAVFVLLNRKRPSIPGGKLPGWLFNTTRFVARNAIKTESRRRKHERVAAGMRPEVEHDHTNSPSSAADWAEVGPVLDRAVAKLNTGERDVVLLHFFQNMTLADAARKLGISEVAARQRSSRAVGKLRQILAGQGVACSAAGLVETMRRHAVAGAPDGLAAKTAAGATSSTTAGAALASAATAAATAVKIKVAAAVLAGATVLTGGVVAVQHHLAATPAAPTAKSSAPAAPDLSAIKTFHGIATIREDGFNPQVRQILIDFPRNQLVESATFAGETYLTWFDGSGSYSFRQGGDTVVRRSRIGATMNTGDGRKFITRLGSWPQQGAKREPAADSTLPDGTRLAAYQVARWPLAGNRPITIWVDSANKPRLAHRRLPGDETRFEMHWDRSLPAAEFPTALPKNARVVDDDALAAELFPLDKSLFRTEAASHVLAVHSIRRDTAGNFHVIVSARPNDAARPLSAHSPPPNFVVRPDNAKSRSVTVVGSQYVGGVTIRHVVVTPTDPASPDPYCDFDATMLLWGQITQALQERKLPMHGQPHVHAGPATPGGSPDAELRRTFDLISAQTGLTDGGLVTSIQGTIPNDTSAGVVGWDKFREIVTAKLKG